jgi:hypothetical protein
MLGLPLMVSPKVSIMTGAADAEGNQPTRAPPAAKITHVKRSKRLRDESLMIVLLIPDFGHIHRGKPHNQARLMLNFTNFPSLLKKHDNNPCQQWRTKMKEGQL